jgi:hypothetical protein
MSLIAHNTTKHPGASSSEPAPDSENDNLALAIDVGVCEYDHPVNRIFLLAGLPLRANPLLKTESSWTRYSYD